LWADTVGSQSRAHGDDGVRFDEYRTQSPVVPFRDSYNGKPIVSRT